MARPSNASTLRNKADYGANRTHRELVLYPPDKRLFDISNRAESLMDLLVDAKIIEDDNYKIVPELLIKFGEIDREKPRAEIIIKTL